jgi:transposase
VILTAEDPRQVYFTSRSESVRDEVLVRTVDEVVGQLDLAALYACWSEQGRAFYDPAMMLKLLFFSYCDGERHSREIAKRIRYDIRYQYFVGSHRPSYRTICRFRNIDVELLAGYFSRIVSICAELGLLDTSLLAIDGSKIKASASRRRTLRRKELDSLTEKFKELLCDDAVREADELGEKEEEEAKNEESLSDRELRERVSQALAKLRAGELEVNLTDGEARLMKTSDGGIRPCYNGQIAVDKNQVIVAADLGNRVSDAASFQPLVEQSWKNLEHRPATIVTDGGYFSGDNLKYIAANDLDVYMPTASGHPETAAKFDRANFLYDEDGDNYICPAGELLSRSYERVQHGLHYRIYRCSVSCCCRCALKSRCTSTGCRTLSISEVWQQEREMKEKVRGRTGASILGQRKVMVEPVFGNLKFNLGFSRFLLRGLRKVRGEFLLMCIAHNLRKMSRHCRQSRGNDGSLQWLIKQLRELLAALGHYQTSLVTIGQI